ncbi:spermatogenesis-associated protein 2-like protein [Xyrauchen texanus]|uniref:spermatogenesis-associated protein 2-like protein n=1 Tax=Xyrauchen texanus TaxID=154827 RepID=UPI0022427195|nr:spermatogenesis-associated protein 2-like protein [Xyrauchen texanus]
MSSVGQKIRVDDLIQKYHTNLEIQLKKGDRSLVCIDEQLCKEVEMLLTKDNAQKTFNICGVDPLTVMENSLRALPFKTGHLGLEKLSKAFGVLELAALNLYLYPWRREYRVVKMFSGMFTHSIKPALTLQQAKELFGLLGYQPSGPSEEEELILHSKLVPADSLLNLACGFFTARMECQLLHSTLGALDRGAEWVLQLIKERKSGHNLQVALENIKRKLEASHSSGMNLDLDLYTDNDLVSNVQADAPQMTPTSCLLTHSSYMQPKETPLLSNPLYGDSFQSDSVSNEDASQGRALCVSTLQYQINNPTNHVSPLQIPGLLESSGKVQNEGYTRRQGTDVGPVMCSCITPSCLFIYQCDLCKDIHSSLCEHYNECKKKGHTLALCQDKVGQQQKMNMQQDQHKPGKEKDSLKKHYCMSNSLSETFLVCYTCQLIHDQSCTRVKSCTMQSHNMLPTGKLQLPQGERANAPKRHVCLTADSPVYVICNTCNDSHDCICGHVKNCIKLDHDVQYLQESGDSETPDKPISYHQCYTANQHWPEIVCLSCNVFCFSGCPDGRQCSQKHKIRQLKTKCVNCSDSELFILCRYCCDVYCKKCWFKSPILCKCGMSFNSPV